MKTLFFILKVTIIVYLATQAFASYDLLALIYKHFAGVELKPPLGINITNTVSFFLAAVFITTKEIKRSKRIGYHFSPETTRKIKTSDFEQELNESMQAIVNLRFPHMIPLQFSDILTTQGFEVQKKSDADGVLKYVEELSPMEVATNAILRRLRQGTLSRQFKLELHHKKEHDAVTINSGNPNTDSYLCMGSTPAAPCNSVLPILASEAAIRMFFESESQICRRFEAFSRFYSLVETLPASYEKYGSESFDAIRNKLVQEIDEILKLDPRFLTIKVLKGVISFHQRNKSTKTLKDTETLFLETIATARDYNANWKRARREASTPDLSKKEEASDIANHAQISRQTMYYVQGLSELFLGRIFTQTAHRFGAFDSNSQNYCEKLKAAKKRLHHGMRYLSAAKARFPLLARFNPFRRARIPLAYQTLGLLYHCHDFFDKDEVYYKNPSRGKGTAHSVKDLRKATKIYEQGLKLCKNKIRLESPDFALHSSTRIHNNLGYARLYSSLIHCKLENLELRSHSNFAQAEFDLLFCAFETKTFYGYSLANLGLLYAMEGEWELSWKAGIAALDSRVYDTIKERHNDKKRYDALDTTFSPDTVTTYRAELESAINELAIECPTAETSGQRDWSYIEGISELAGGFLLRGICESEQTSSREFLNTGLEIHRIALNTFIHEEVEENATISESCMDRFKNILTNFVRIYWHFDDRKYTNAITEKLDRIHKQLHATIRELTNGEKTNTPSKAEFDEIVAKWLTRVETELST